MKLGFIRVSATALAASAGWLMMSASTEAAQMRVYDPTTRSFLTYDTDEVRRDAGLPPEDGEQQARAPRTPPSVAPAPPPTPQQHADPDPKFDRQVVSYETTEAPGTIIIDTEQRFLYYVMENGEALRMGVGVGREGFGWTGVVHVGAKQENPKWFPPDDMVARQPELAKYQAEGMAGGEGNPLGVRAIYLHDDAGKDTLYRIHGTIEPWSIGLNVSSGCIRMLNENVTELYGMVEIGTKVVVI